MDTTSSATKMFSALLSQQDVRSQSATTSLSSGITLYQKGKYKEAVASFKQSAAFNPAQTDAYNYMASAYLKLGNKTEAIKAYKISLSLDRSQSEIHMNLGNIYVDNKNYADAEKQYKAAASADPTSAIAPYTLGLMYMQNGRLDEAETLFKKVTKMSPTDGNPRYALGKLYNEKGNYNEAVKQLTQAVILKKDFTNAYFELGKAYANQSLTDKAQEMINKLKGMETSTSVELAEELEEMITRPKISEFNAGNSTFNPKLTPNVFASGVILAALDASLALPNSSKIFTMQFKFDRDMDASSVMNISNWNIRKATGGTAGIYDNGLYRPTNTAVSPIPERVVYDPTTRQATVSFRVSQNSSGTGTIDPSRMVFKFSGKDITGKSIDPNADEYNGFGGVF